MSELFLGGTMTFTPEQVKEAKEYYRKVAKEKLGGKKQSALKVLVYFDHYPNAYGDYHNKKQNLLRVQSMLERYFKMKELGRL